MYAITGVTGHVGGAVAGELLDAGAPVRVVVRDPEKGRAWSEVGAEVAAVGGRRRRCTTTLDDTLRRIVRTTVT